MISSRIQLIFKNNSAHIFRILTTEVKKQQLDVNRLKYQFGCGISKMVGPKKQDFCNVVTRFQGFHLIF